MSHTGATPSARRYKRLESFADLYRSPTHSLYRKKLAALDVSPSDSMFAKLNTFLRGDFLGWARHYLATRFGPKLKPFPRYPAGDDGIYPLRGDSFLVGQPPCDEPVRVSFAGDWATGTSESATIAKHMTSFSPHYTIHLGDVYFVGDPPEVRENCLGLANPQNSFEPVTWPIGTVGSFGINGNHEMYAGGEAYFQLFLPALGLRPAPGVAPASQKASFFCLENDYWRIIGLDTGYNSLGLPILEQVPLLNRIPGIGPTCCLDKAQIEWLGDKVRADADKRGVILLAHHQYYSSFDIRYTRPARQISKFINRPVIWFWGHEHRMAIYDLFGSRGALKAYGRCIGHAGMPVDRGNPKCRRAPWLVYDNRVYKTFGKTAVGFNGFVNLTLAKDVLDIEYRDVNNAPLVRERWKVSLDTGTLDWSRPQIILDDPDLKHR